MGAFLAGVLLSESTFRHQLEADVEPFRGLLLGLFFMAVGMSLDLAVVVADWRFILAGVALMMLGKGACIYAVARLTRSSHADALDRAALMAQGGEFAFVLYAAAASAGLLSAQVSAALTAIVILSMILTPLVTLAARRFIRPDAPSLDGIEEVSDATGSVLLIGFGRFGQVTSQSLLARDVDVTIIDTDTDMIRSAAGFGFKIYYGDGTRLDVLRAAGADRASAIAICVDRAEVATHIARIVRESFPQAKLLVRAYDREHSLLLATEGVDLQVRETFESALRFGELALRELGVDADEAAAIAADVRRRDTERFQLELAAGDVTAGLVMLRGNIKPTPTPFTPPRRESRTLNPPEGEATGAGPAP
jgi:glutathione-regulated potassium-efflux system protein KefB